MLQLLFLAAGTLVSEDLTCIGAGVLVAQGKLTIAPAVLACLSGIFAGDMSLVLLGRLGGFAAARSRWMRRALPPDQLETAGMWISQRGLAVAFLSRFTPGLRLPTYFMAGLLRTRLLRFSGCLLLASSVWTPLLVGGAAIFGTGVLKAALANGENAVRGAILLIAAIALTRLSVRTALNSEFRRRIAAFVFRASRWEFWPAWAAYLPLAPYLAFLALKHRSVTLFTAANPGIPTGGLAGESKSAILEQLSRAEGLVPRHALISGALSTAMRVQLVDEFLRDHGLDFPVVLKPDVGERGSGVAIVWTREHAQAHFAGMPCDTIVQEYIPGIEFGLFYVRFPMERVGKIFSMTWKQFPEVSGNGTSSLRELVRLDARAFCLESVYERSCPRPLDEVPARGERVPLVEVGSHCKGAVFVNGFRWWTSELERVVDELAKAHAGFYFGRFDVRAESLEALSRGRFKVLELNGVGSEATHIYDPSVSIWAAYRTMAEQWRLAFELGKANRELGCSLMTAAELIRALRRRPGQGAANVSGSPEQFPA